MLIMSNLTLSFHLYIIKKKQKKALCITIPFRQTENMQNNPREIPENLMKQTQIQNEKYHTRKQEENGVPGIREIVIII